MMSRMVIRVNTYLYWIPETHVCSNAFSCLFHNGGGFYWHHREGCNRKMECILSDGYCPDLTAYAGVLKHSQFSYIGEFQVSVLHDMEGGLGIRY